MQEDNKSKATFFVLLCVALWALIPVVAKLGQSELDNHQFLFWSSLVSLIVLGISTLVTGQYKSYRNYTLRDTLYLMVLGLLGTYIYYLFLYLGYASAKGMEVLVVQYTWPILIVIFSFFILKEEINIQKSVSIVLGFAGVVVMIGANAEGADFSNFKVILLVGVGASCFALFSVLSKRVNHPEIAVVTVYFFVATLASFISMNYFSEFALPNQNEFLPIAANGIFVNGFSYVFWMLALRSSNASYVAPFTFITPILSAIYLVIFFEEPFLLIYALGLTLVISGGLLNVLPLRKGV